MDKEHIKGVTDKAKGAMKEAAGKITGDKQMQAKASSTRPRARRMKLPATPRRRSARQTVISIVPAEAAVWRPFFFPI